MILDEKCLEQCAREFVKKGRIWIPAKYTDERALNIVVPRVIKGYADFRQLPDEIKSLWIFDFSRLDGKTKPDPDDGYVKKERKKKGNEEEYDTKEYFHLRYFFRRLLVARGIDFRPQEEWLDACYTLYWICQDIKRELGRMLDRAYPGYNFGIKLAEGKEQDVLRILQYPRPEPGTVIGKRHWDRSCFTIRIGDSHRGLRFVGEDSFIENREDKVLIFTGAKSENASNGLFQPHKYGRHEVVETRLGEQEENSSIVFFAHTLDPYPHWFKENV